MQARFAKDGRRLPDTGHGCGCRLCEESGATRYERRAESRLDTATWGPLRRMFVRLAMAWRPVDATVD
jgi:hypothetical protein